MVSFEGVIIGIQFTFLTLMQSIANCKLGQKMSLLLYKKMLSSTFPLQL